MRNSVTTKEIVVMIVVEKNHKSMSQHSKECCNKVEQLEVDNFFATKENYVTTKDEKMRTKDCRNTVYFMLRHCKLMSQHKARLKDKKFCRDKEIYVATFFKRRKE